jgi:uncharacterized peroxidase-related enzyme
MSMPHFPAVDESNCQPEVARVFADIRRSTGLHFVPNFFRTLAICPDALTGTWTAYRDIGRGGTLPHVLKEMVFSAISVARNCKYCAAAHLAFCKVLGADPASLAALSGDLDALQPRRTREVVKFGVKCALNPAGIAESDLTVLRGHGLSDAEVVELVSMCAFSTYATIVADALKLETDAGFMEILKADTQ